MAEETDGAEDNDHDVEQALAELGAEINAIEAMGSRVAEAVGEMEGCDEQNGAGPEEDGLQLPDVADDGSEEPVAEGYQQCAANAAGDDLLRKKWRVRGGDAGEAEENQAQRDAECGGESGGQEEAVPDFGGGERSHIVS